MRKNKTQKKSKCEDKSENIEQWNNLIGIGLIIVYAVKCIQIGIRIMYSDHEMPIDFWWHCANWSSMVKMYKYIISDVIANQYKFTYNAVESYFIIID